MGMGNGYSIPDTSASVQCTLTLLPPQDLIKLLQENGGRTVDNSMVQSVLDPNNSMLLSVNNDSFSFVDITNTSPLSKSFSRTEGGGEDGR